MSHVHDGLGIRGLKKSLISPTSCKGLNEDQNIQPIIIWHERGMCVCLLPPSLHLSRPPDSFVSASTWSHWAQTLGFTKLMLLKNGKIFLLKRRCFCIMLDLPVKLSAHRRTNLFIFSWLEPYLNGRKPLFASRTAQVWPWPFPFGKSGSRREWERFTCNPG